MPEASGSLQRSRWRRSDAVHLLAAQGAGQRVYRIGSCPGTRELSGLALALVALAAGEAEHGAVHPDGESGRVALPGRRGVKQQLVAAAAEEAVPAVGGVPPAALGVGWAGEHLVR